MGYFLMAHIAKKETFDKLGVESVPLGCDLHITTRAVDVAMVRANGDCVASVTADYFGGEGEQSAGWFASDMIEVLDNEYGAINTVLARLGVVRSEGTDEFDTVGLGRHRDNDWMPMAQESTSDDEV